MPTRAIGHVLVGFLAPGGLLDTPLVFELVFLMPFVVPLMSTPPLCTLLLIGFVLWSIGDGESIPFDRKGITMVNGRLIADGEAKS